MLHKIQHTFKESVLQEKDDVATYLSDNMPGLTKEERIHIYRNNTFVSLKQVLVDSFPAVTALVSIEFMRYVCHAFVKHHPPKNGALMFYGEEFPKFIGTFEAAKGFPYLEDVATLEWQLSQAYDVEDTEALTALDLEQVENIGDLKPKLAPHVRLIRSNYALYNIWKAAKFKDETQEEFNVNTPDHVLVYRNNESLDTHAQSISAGYFTFLESIQHGASLEQATLNALEIEEQFNIQETLASILSLGLLKK